MTDGSSSITAGADAASKVVPLTSQYPMAVALLVVAAFSGLVIWLLFKYILKKGDEKLQASVDNDVKIASLLDTQSKTIAAQNVELRALRESYVRIAVALAKLMTKLGHDVDLGLETAVDGGVAGVMPQPPKDGG